MKGVIFLCKQGKIRETAPTGGIIMKCTSIPTNLISMVPVLENIFCITFLHMHLSMLWHAFNKFRPFSAQYCDVSLISHRGKEQLS